MKTIDSFQNEYRFLSNFWPVTVTYKGIIYPSAENAYQAQKCFFEQDKIKFKTISAGEAKRLGKHVMQRPKWEKEKLEAMNNIVASKFTQHPDLCLLLHATGDVELIEGNTWNDTFWGRCNGIGQNNLGKILMKVREKLL